MSSDNVLLLVAGIIVATAWGLWALIGRLEREFRRLAQQFEEAVRDLGRHNVREDPD